MSNREEVFDGTNENPFLLVNTGTEEAVMRSSMGHKVNVPPGHGILIGLNGRIYPVAPGDTMVLGDVPFVVPKAELEALERLKTALSIHCDRCGCELPFAQHESAGESFAMTVGYYLKDGLPWSQYANPGEKRVCDACMQHDPRYIAEYGPPQNEVTG